MKETRIKSYFGSLQIMIELTFFSYIIDCLSGYNLEERRSWVVNDLKYINFEPYWNNDCCWSNHQHRTNWQWFHDNKNLLPTHTICNGSVSGLQTTFIHTVIQGPPALFILWFHFPALPSSSSSQKKEREN